MASGQRLHHWWDPQERDGRCHRTYALNRPIVSEQTAPKVLLRRSRVSRGEVLGEDHVLLRRSQRPRFSAGF